MAVPRKPSAAARVRGAIAGWLAAATLGLAGCGGGIVIGDFDFDCDEEIEHATHVHGTPDRIDRHVESGLHVHTFWYVGSGLGITFIWGGDLGCERRDFRT